MSLDYETYPLKELNEGASVFSGFAFKSKDFSDDGIPIVKIKNIQNKSVDLKEVQYFPLDKVNNKHKKFFLKNNDVLIAMTGQGSLGRVGRINLESNEYVLLNQRVGKFVVDEKNLHLNYLYHVISSDMYEKILFDRGTGSGQPNLSPEISLGTEIPMPNLTTQKKISSILDNINSKINLNKKINKNLEEQLNLIFNDWFVNCTPFKNEELIKLEWGFVPESWKDIEFGELIEITSGDRPKEKSEIKTSEFKIPLFGASKIMGYTKEVLYHEDILIIGRVGTHGVVQRVNYPCFPSDNTFVIKSKYYGFVYQLLKKIDYDSLNTGSTQPLITQKSLKTVNVVLPDKKILSIFEMISKVIFDKIYLNNNEIFNLTKLRDTLLPKLMSGEIDVSKINCDLELICKLTLFTHKYPNQLCKHKLIHLNLKSLRKSKNTAFKVDFGQFLFYN